MFQQLTQHALQVTMAECRYEISEAGGSHYQTEVASVVFLMPSDSG
jgi:hypothetical protein